MADATINSARILRRVFPNNSEQDHCQNEISCKGNSLLSNLNFSWPVLIVAWIAGNILAPLDAIVV